MIRIMAKSMKERKILKKKLDQSCSRLRNTSKILSSLGVILNGLRMTALFISILFSLPNGLALMLNGNVLKKSSLAKAAPRWWRMESLLEMSSRENLETVGSSVPSFAWQLTLSFSRTWFTTTVWSLAMLSLGSSRMESGNLLLLTLAFLTIHPLKSLSMPAV